MYFVQEEGEKKSLELVKTRGLQNLMVVYWRQLCDSGIGNNISGLGLQISTQYDINKRDSNHPF